MTDSSLLYLHEIFPACSKAWKGLTRCMKSQCTKEALMWTLRLHATPLASLKAQSNHYLVSHHLQNPAWHHINALRRCVICQWGVGPEKPPMPSSAASLGHTHEHRPIRWCCLLMRLPDTTFKTLIIMTPSVQVQQSSSLAQGRRHGSPPGSCSPSGTRPTETSRGKHIKYDRASWGLKSGSWC